MRPFDGLLERRAAAQRQIAVLAATAALLIGPTVVVVENVAPAAPAIAAPAHPGITPPIRGGGLPPADPDPKRYVQAWYSHA
jgi:hypothetical protein